MNKKLTEAKIRQMIRNQLSEAYAPSTKKIYDEIVKFLSNIGYQDGFNAGGSIVMEIVHALNDEVKDKVPRDTMKAIKKGIISNMKNFEKNTKGIG